MRTGGCCAAASPANNPPAPTSAAAHIKRLSSVMALSPWRMVAKGSGLGNQREVVSASVVWLVHHPTVRRLAGRVRLEVDDQAVANAEHRVGLDVGTVGDEQM